jgi:ribonucleoside-triphosphate reductase
VKKAYINEYFQLDDTVITHLESLKPDFGYNGFGEFIFYRTYSRTKHNGKQENWADVVIRVINGVMSIRKDHYIRNHIEWDEKRWQDYATEMAYAMFHMYWLPPGRGLWAMGTSFVVERGSMALYNCAATKLGSNDRFANDCHWLMDALMLGVGVGFEALRDDLKTYKPHGKFDYEIPDTREGWCDATKLLLEAYTQPGRYEPEFDYSAIRKAGEPIKGFGGQASGPGPLIALHDDIRRLCTTPGLSPLRLKTDIANKIGCCVVAGNVRRSAELAKGSITDREFMDLKDYDKYPEREDFGWMSNNTVALNGDEDFERLGEVARRVIQRGEPGIMNLRNMKLGRIGRDMKGLREDAADQFNPCGEIPLEDKETCNISETLPTRCPNDTEWLRACEFASFYSSTVSLLPTHRSETNAVIARNRRIGVGIVDITGWIHNSSMNRVIKLMRSGYDVVRGTNRMANAEAGVPEAIRVTTVKPGGTVPKVAGRTSGAGYPTFEETLFTIRVAANAPVVKVLDKAKIPWEPEVFQPKETRVYMWPAKQGPAPPAERVSLWQQAMLLTMIQREWADNAVSNTLYFRPKWVLTHHVTTLAEIRKTLKTVVKAKELNEAYSQISSAHGRLVIHEDKARKYVLFYDKWAAEKVQLKRYKFDPTHEEDIIEPVLASIAPLIKSCSLLPHAAKGVYRQMPQQGITPEEYAEMTAKLGKLDWTSFTGDGIPDAESEKYCSGGVCELPRIGMP